MSLRILLVEDEPARAETLQSALRDRVFSNEVDYETCTNVHAAAELLRNHYYDLLILDILLPMREGGEPVGDGGVRLLRALKTHADLRLPGYTIGLTAHENLAALDGADFNESMWMILRYDPSTDAWIERIANHITHILGAHESLNSEYDFDLGIVTALHAIELESVLALAANWETKTIAGDDAIYHVGSFSGPNGKMKVAATASHEMGMSAAGIVSMKLIDQFRPRYLAMTGIAAGVVGSFGDILIADQSWDYGSGKTITKKDTTTIFSPAPSAILVDPGLKYRLSWFVSRRRALEKIRASWTGRDVPSSLAAHLGPIASGASVVQSQPPVRQIESHNRKVIGVEMETYGVFLAARLCRKPRPVAMSFKSVADFADLSKSDKYQDYAAFTSANFLYEFALDSLLASTPQ